MDRGLVIKNGTIVDGTGRSGFRADVRIRNEKIVEISRSVVTTGSTVIDARGLVVAPGFIDMHSHDDWGVLYDPVNKHSLQQGVTTVICGQCGSTPFPVDERAKSYLEAQVISQGSEKIEISWYSMEEYLNFLERRGIGTNFAFLVGHGTIRIAVMGMERRKPTPDESRKMQMLTVDCVREGAFGLSTGLIYPPGVFADFEEIVDLCKVVAQHGGIYVTHMRDEGDRVFDALEEAFLIGRTAKVPVHISHHKVSGFQNWGKASETLGKIEAANDSGLTVTADAYPYTAGSTMLAALLPPWAHEGGETKLIERVRDPECRSKIKSFMLEKTDWQNFAQQITGWDAILVTSTRVHKEYEGKNLLEIARAHNKNPLDMLLDICSEEGYKAQMVIFMMDERDVERIVCHPLVAIGSDSAADRGTGFTHPRGYGTFTKILRVYVREKQLLILEEAVRKMTSLPARVCGLRGKGVVKEGYDADLTIFKPETVSDRATYMNPRELSDGIEWVIVNGKLAYRQGEVVEPTAGSIVKRTLRRKLS